MTPDEVEERFAHRAPAFWLGRNAFEGEHPIGFSDDRHIMLVSGSRGGKGVSMIVPNLCLWPGSLVVVDPKGENASVTAARRGQGSAHCEGMGQAVHVLDPMGTARVEDRYRASFNPLDALDPASPHVIDDATRLADALVEIGQGESRHWDESARYLIRTLILHVLTHPHYEGRRNLVTVRLLILSGESGMAEELRERALQRGESSSASGHVVLWELARRNDALGGIIAASAESFLESAKNSPKQYNSYCGIARVCTDFLDSPGMAACVSSSSFRLADLKTDPRGVSLYLSLPQRFMITHYRWLRMMIALTITEMETVPGQPASGAPVLLALDEFAGLRRMEIIENGVAQIAGFGVKLFFVLQSLEQLKSVYPDRWETFLANCGVRILFATTDNFTNQYVSDALGEQEIIRTLRSTGRSETDTRSESESFGETWGEQSSKATTRSESSTIGWGGSNSWTRGGNESRSRGSGRSENEGTSYGPAWFFALRTGRQSGSGTSTNKGSSHGTSWSDGMGRNWSKSRTRTRSTTNTQGSSHGTSSTTQTGTSHASGQSSGTSEQIFKKPLISRDEMAKLFTRIDDPEHRAYPGLALVSIAGEAPMLLRRTSYFADPAFAGLFDPHPDYPLFPAPDLPKALPVAQDAPQWPNTADVVIHLNSPRSDTTAISNLALAQKQKSLPKQAERHHTALIHAPIHLVRQVFLDTSYHDEWFRTADSRLGTGNNDLIKVLYPGRSIPSGFISSIDANQPDHLAIEFCCASVDLQVPIFFGFQISSMDDETTKLTIRKYWHRPSKLRATMSRFGLASIGIGPRLDTSPFATDDPDLLDPSTGSGQHLSKDDLYEDVRTASLALKYFCEDVINYGMPHSHEGSATFWIEAESSGIIQLVGQDIRGTLPQPGDVITRRDLINGYRIIGQIITADHLKYDICISRPGIVISLENTDGGIIEKGQRIMKLEATER